MARNEILEDIEVAAGAKLGVERWDRPAIFRESAEAATDGDLPYWLVLLLSGAIATLGLALDSSAVVIGAMLVAPLLAPVEGMALALTTGDGRLAVQTATLILASTLGVVAVAAALTALLPFQTITPEISARTRPTTLDLWVAVFSGAAGAVVTVARGKRLSAAVPGVAISVALIPPLAVAGFGIGVRDAAMIRGSLLLYGANLAGIVLSGMLVFLLVGMHGPRVLEAARSWHETGGPTGLVAWVDHLPWVASLGVIRSFWARIGLVLAFVVAMALPLRETLAEITREQRVQRAIESAAAMFEEPGRSSVVGRQVVRGSERTQVYLRVATARWFGPQARAEFEREASAAAGEPVGLVLEQLPASSGDVEQLADLLPRQGRASPPPPPLPSGVGDLLTELRGRIAQAASTLPFPARARLVGVELAITSGRETTVVVAYSAPDPLGPDAEEILSRQLARVLGEPVMRVRLRAVSRDPRPLEAAPGDSVLLREAASLLTRFEGLVVELRGAPGDSLILRRAARALSESASPARVQTRIVQQGSPSMRLLPGADAPDPTAEGR